MGNSWTVISRTRQREMLLQGNYLCMDELSPANGYSEFDPDIKHMISLGEKFETLDTCGNIEYHTLTSFIGANGPSRGVITRHKNGDHKRMEFYLDSGLFPRYDIGWKPINKFPWEVINPTQSQQSL